MMRAKSLFQKRRKPNSRIFVFGYTVAERKINGQLFSLRILILEDSTQS